MKQQQPSLNMNQVRNIENKITQPQQTTTETRSETQDTRKGVSKLIPMS